MRRDTVCNDTRQSTKWPPNGPRRGREGHHRGAFIVYVIIAVKERGGFGWGGGRVTGQVTQT